ncbi:Modification methylase HgaIA (Cytosine-specificmethyltransferase HgaIA) [Streptococcus sp. HSISB1]|nr:Modification methylase HgaIA (Cytosine-specificmethyltransferase HgaIA) [Streptococcus sp. HSISB1]
MKGISLFASAGIGEYFLKRNKIDIIVANELIEKRALLHRKLYPSCDVVIGDITDKNIYKKIIDSVNKEKIDFIIASPPCQGMSVAGKNRKLQEMSEDERNYLILSVIKAIKDLNPNYVIIENVPLLLKLVLKINDEYLNVEEILNRELSDFYIIHSAIYDTADYGVPQHRKRAIIRLYKKGLKWEEPQKYSKYISVEEAIGNLPSLESGEKSDINWHFARNHDKRQVEWMRHTPTGKSAFENTYYYPKKKNGDRVKGFNSSYRRLKWEEPSPTITIRNDAISSQRNVHPGRKKLDGTFSDARVLTILELFRLTGLPDDINIPLDTPEILVRQIIGECIPPLLIESIVKGIE